MFFINCEMKNYKNVSSLKSLGFLKEVLILSFLIFLLIKFSSELHIIQLNL